MTAHEEPKIIDLARYARPAASRPVSPYRYPGGKGFLAGYLAHEINEYFQDEKPTFIEPYCGGAGAALHLLQQNIVSDIILNDADIRIYSAWNAMINETDRFIARIENVSVNIPEWQRCVEIIHSSTSADYNFELGFATFFINRTSRSGVILGSGPIGGYDQTGKWKIDARFNKKGLIERIRTLAKLGDKITLCNRDALMLCRDLDTLATPSKSFLFIDPPYVDAGGRLYMDAMSPAKHILLSEWLSSGEFPNWILTYDDHPLIRENYNKIKPYHLCVNYSLAKKRLEKELLYRSWG